MGWLGLGAAAGPGQRSRNAIIGEFGGGELKAGQQLVVDRTHVHLELEDEIVHVLGVLPRHPAVEVGLGLEDVLRQKVPLRSIIAMK